MVHRDARYVAAALQGIVGWEWLVSGANKVLSGTFPTGMADTLNSGMKDNPNGWYVAFLQAVVLPHSILFGYLIEVAEVLAGLGLLAGTLLLVGGIRSRGEPQYRIAVAQIAAAALAALTCIFLCVNFHFFMGDGILPGLDPTHAFDQGVDLDTLMPPMALLILVFNLYVLGDMSGVPIVDFPRRAAECVRSLVAHERHAAPGAADSITG